MMKITNVWVWKSNRECCFGLQNDTQQISVFSTFQHFKSNKIRCIHFVLFMNYVILNQEQGNTKEYVNYQKVF